MFYLTAAVTVALAATALNLLLTFGVIRKLRVHDAKLAGRGAVVQDATLAAGTAVPPVTATTLEGGTVSSVRPGASQLVGFFSVGCGACDERIPEFIAYQQRTGVAAFAVVVTDADDSGPYVARLSTHVDVVVERERGPLATTFGVTSFPALCLVDSAGVVVAGGNAFPELPEFVPA
jgi:thiol-disulfide isomerase/thioredoxin